MSFITFLEQLTILKVSLYLISILAFIHVLLLSIYFFTRKKTKQKEHVIFGFLLLSFSVVILSNILTMTPLLFIYSKTLFLSRHIALIVVPLMYIYIDVILTGKFYSSKDYLQHFMLFIVSTPILIGILFSIDQFDIYNSNLRFVTGFLILFQNSYYLWHSFNLIKENKDNKKVNDKIKWSRALLFIFLFIWMIQFCSFLLIDLYRNFFICPYTVSMYFLTAFVFVYILIYLMIEVNKIISHKSKYKSSEISEEALQHIYNKIEEHFEKDTPFIENDFSIAKLSNDLEVSVKKLSRAINYITNTNFNDFVNQYRLEESKRLLLENTKQELSISEIYYMVGFNSKSTFNTLFKKQYGKTPSEFRK